MKINIFTFFIIILFFVSSCSSDNSKRIYFFQGSYFQENQELELNVNDGEFVYRKKFSKNYSRDSNELIKKFKPTTDSVKIYLKINNKDTLIIIPSSTKKVLFGNDAYTNLFLYTEKDTDAWLNN